MDVVILLFFVGLVIFAYLLPSFVAPQRKHVNTTAICVLNILVGWSFIGWVAALVWAFVKSGDKKMNEQTKADMISILNCMLM
nr:MAG: Superinfection immunity protein [Bacteriophage sp.]